MQETFADLETAWGKGIINGVQFVQVTWRNQVAFRGGDIQQSGGSMPLFTVTMKSNRSTKENGRLSRAIHAASIATGYPEDDLFQRFLSLGPSNLSLDLYYPALPKITART